VKKKMKIEQIQPTGLLHLPTPLMEAPRLSAKMGASKIFIKRDDLTGLALGGNKGRALEYLLTDTKNTGTDIIVAVGPQQSNWLCNLSAAARKLGMDVTLFILMGDDRVQGNLLLDKLLGAEIIWTGMDVHALPTLYKKMDILADELRRQGRRPFVFHYGPVAPLGIAGYVYLVSEICEQLQEKGVKAQHLFLASGSGCTQAGLILGAKYFKANFNIIGVNPSGTSSKTEKIHKIADLANQTAKLLEMDCVIDPGEIIVYDEYIGNGPVPTKESIEAIKLVGQTEGIFLDPIYTGKAMAALIDQIHKGNIPYGDTVIFYHSGGLPAIFAYQEALAG
jgi:D-cysteine desulfhydrase